jgi:hypothetical protein
MKKYFQIVKVYAPRDQNGNVAQINLTLATPKHPDWAKYIKLRPDDLVKLLGGDPDWTKNDLGLIKLWVELKEDIKFVDSSEVPMTIKNPE